MIFLYEVTSSGFSLTGLDCPHLLQKALFVYASRLLCRRGVSEGICHLLFLLFRDLGELLAIIGASVVVVSVAYDDFLSRPANTGDP